MMLAKKKLLLFLKYKVLWRSLEILFLDNGLNFGFRDLIVRLKGYFGPYKMDNPAVNNKNKFFVKL